MWLITSLSWTVFAKRRGFRRFNRYGKRFLPQLIGWGKTSFHHSKDEKMDDSPCRRISLFDVLAYCCHQFDLNLFKFHVVRLAIFAFQVRTMLLHAVRVSVSEQ